MEELSSSAGGPRGSSGRRTCKCLLNPRGASANLTSSEEKSLRSDGKIGPNSAASSPPPAAAPGKTGLECQRTRGFSRLTSSGSSLNLSFCLLWSLKTSGYKENTRNNNKSQDSAAELLKVFKWNFKDVSLRLHFEDFQIFSVKTGLVFTSIQFQNKILQTSTI